jgi:hypothetical protein
MNCGLPNTSGSKNKRKKTMSQSKLANSAWRIFKKGNLSSNLALGGVGETEVSKANPFLRWMSKRRELRALKAEAIKKLENMCQT